MGLSALPLCMIPGVFHAATCADFVSGNSGEIGSLSAAKNSVIAFSLTEWICREGDDTDAGTESKEERSVEEDWESCIEAVTDSATGWVTMLSREADGIST